MEGDNAPMILLIGNELVQRELMYRAKLLGISENEVAERVFQTVTELRLWPSFVDVEEAVNEFGEGN